MVAVMRRVAVIFVCILGTLPAVRVHGVPPAFSNQTNAAGLIIASHQISGIDFPAYASGCAVGDFNSDGFQDLFFTGGGSGGRLDRLFINNGNGTFTDQAPAWGVSILQKGKGGTVGDFDRDGDLDLYVVSVGPAAASAPGHHKLYRNNGNSTFTNVAAAAGVNTTNSTNPDGWSANFTDYDIDGDLDLFVSGSSPGNAGSKLFRNNNDGTFTNVTSTSGTGGGNMWTGSPGMFGFTPLFGDMDGDHYPDLMFISDFNTSRYFKNNGNGTFTNVTTTAGAGLEENGMGGNIGDWNNDGKLDYYATSIYQPASGWTGNKLYRNNSSGPGVHNYQQVAGTAQVADGGYGWGTVLVDFNHDMLLDIAATDGSTSPPFLNEQTYLWTNDGDGTFTEVAVASGFIHNGQGRALVNFDFDNDGDQDVAICNNNQVISFFRNDLPAGPDTHWLRVFLDSGAIATIAPDGIGTVVRATVGGVSMARLIHTGGFQGNSEISAHFGLAGNTVVSELRLEWPNGTITTLNNVAANQTITLCPRPGDMNGDTFIDGLDIVHFIAVQLDQPPASGTNPVCAEYGQGTPEGNLAAFVSDLLN
jgi:hypothetical protein